MLRDRFAAAARRARAWRPPSWASQLLLVVVLVMVAVVAYNFGARGTAPSAGASADGAGGAGEPAATERWTCSMHPQVNQPEPGQCPICGMDLVPAGDAAPAGDAGDAPRLEMSESAVALAGVRTATVERREVEQRVRMVGFVDHDPTRVRVVPARAGGRIERLFVDYVGMPVRANDHLAEIDSPELETAQEEYLAARRTARRLEGSHVESLIETTREAVQAARARLEEFGLTTEQVRQLEESGTRPSRVTTFLPSGGIVVEQHVREGDYVKEGEPLVTVSDLSRVWVELRAYQRDLPWLRYGQRVVIEREGSGSGDIEGRIAFISPTLDERTRTATVRVTVDNEDRVLRPGMYVRAASRARLAEEGRVIDPDLAGKWIGPMHPEVVKDGPGTCDVCGMPLVKAESLGFVAARRDRLPLVIPSSAPLITGERAVVYVRVPGEQKPTFEGREITLGPRAGDWYLVREGLEEGEQVVVQGAFRIDSALQIQARSSMMTSGGFGAEDGGRVALDEISGPAREALGEVYDAYLDAVDALAADNRAGQAFTRLAAALDRFAGANLVPGPARRQALSARDAANRSARAADLESARAPLRTLSDALIALHGVLGHPGDASYYVAHCPMAYDFTGADWIQRDGEEIWNPYFGSQMLHCGVIERELAGGSHEH